MSRRPRSWIFALLLLTAPVHSEDARIAVQARITSSEVESGHARGSMELSIVNATDATLRNVTLKLGAPVSGQLGQGVVEVGIIDLDATVGTTVDFLLESTFLQSNDPLVIAIAYDDVSGNRREVNVAARFSAEGGGL